VGTIDSSRRVGAPLDIRVRTDAFDPSPLALVVREQVHRLAGALDSDLRIHGTLERPLVSGFAELRRGLIVLRESGVRFEPVRLRLDADGTSARVTLVRAVTDDGTMTGEGRIDFAAGGALDLTLRPARARIVRRAGMQASAAGELHLGGTIAAPVLSGRLELLDVVIRPAKLPLAQAVPTIDPTIEVAGRPDVPAASPPPAPTAPSALAVALDVHVARGTRVVRSDATLELDGDVHVAKVAGAGARLRGTLWLREGWLVFQDRRFWLTGGAVSFLDTDPPSAWVDAWAQHRAGEYVILVGLVGPIEKPDLRLVSDPPLGETDVLSVLLFGRPSGSLGANEVEGLRQLAVGLAADYAAPGLQRSVLDAFGIDTLTVDVPTGGTEAAGEVRIGRYVGEDLFLSLAQEFGAGVAQVVGAEYVLGAGVSVRVSASSTGRGAVDLLWSHRY
jgi:translocation and assembly module TamB